MSFRGQSEALEGLRKFVSNRQRLLVLTGAGVSTDSGIPDYRSPGRPPHRPIQHQQFLSSPSFRQRYWARSMIGFKRMDLAEPNMTHKALAHAEQQGRIHHIITQNVDGLHQKAGNDLVVNLHGSIHHVQCMDCHKIYLRKEVQDRLTHLNPTFEALVASVSPDMTAPPSLLKHDSHSEASRTLRPDGDVQLHESVYEQFNVPGCDACGGVLKPAVVFFGANVPAITNHTVNALIDEADALLVAGTSLAVWSSLRIVRKALERSIDVAIVNDGPTRADDLVPFKLSERVATAMAHAFDFKIDASTHGQSQHST